MDLCHSLDHSSESDPDYKRGWIRIHLEASPTWTKMSVSVDLSNPLRAPKQLLEYYIVQVGQGYISLHPSAGLLIV